MAVKNYFVIFLFLLGIYCKNGSQQIGKDNSMPFGQMQIADAQIVDAAINVAKEHIDLQNRYVVYDTGNADWVKTMQEFPFDTFPELNGKQYQAIMFSQKEIRPGGPFWVFIDKSDGKVLSYFGFK